MLYDFGRANNEAHVCVIIDDAILSVSKLAKDPSFMGAIWNRRHFIPQGTVSFLIAT